MRIAGVNIPDSKRIQNALTYIYGIGRSNVVGVLKASRIDANTRVKNITEEELGRLQKALGVYKIEGDLRKEISENIKRLKQIKCYRGIRHSHGLPVRGQRTRSNARTKRGKRATVGTIRKEALKKMGLKPEDLVKKQEKKNKK